MPIFKVLKKGTSIEITRYSAANITEFEGALLEDTDHVELIEDSSGVEVVKRVRLTKQEFFDKLGSAAGAFILTAAKTSVEIEMWVKRLDLTTPDPDGTSVDLEDPRTIAGVDSMSQLLMYHGIVDSTWKDEVLNG